MAHLCGFIDGYAGFDANIETEDGTIKFIDDNFEATLDGEHLDKQAHPYDLLNTHLAPEIRKLPSELDVEILQALIATKLEKNGSKLVGEELLASLTSEPLLAIASDAGNDELTYSWTIDGEALTDFLFGGQQDIFSRKICSDYCLPTLQAIALF